MKTKEVSAMSKVLVNTLYDKIEVAMKQKINQNNFKNNLDKYMAANTDAYAAIGPYKRPIFSDNNIDGLITTVGLTRAEIKSALKSCTYIKPSWVEVNKPFNIAISLTIRFFLIQKDDMMLDLALSYFVVSMYPIMHYRYFRYEPNEAALTYTINNLSNKFGLKQDKTLWVTLKKMVRTCLNHFQKLLIEGTDKAIVDFIESYKTRLNSFLKTIYREFDIVYKKKLYLGQEYENLSDDDNYHEASSDSTAIAVITNKVVQSLVVHGPDMRIVTLSANNCTVSVTILRSYLSTMIVNEQRNDIEKIVESLVYLYLVTEGETNINNTIAGINSNDFLIHCMKVYKKSHTVDESVNRIKKILDNWLISLNIREYTKSPNTINNFRRAIYMFFVLSIIKLG